jgi:hypothetical protein
MDVISIWNMALSFLGQPAVASQEENTPSAKYCRLHYESARNYVLRDHPWNFAEGRVRLTPLELPEAWQREYTQAYAYPNKCARLHSLIDQAGRSDERFKACWNGQRRIIVANLPEAVAAYTVLADDATAYDPAFALAVARRLQCLIIKGLLKSNPDALQEAEKLYLMALNDAKTADAREGRKFQDKSRLWQGGHYDGSEAGDWVDNLRRGGGY